MPLTATAGGVDIPDGVYPATILSLEEVPPTANSPKQENFFRWTLHVYSNSEGVEMIANSSMNFSPKAKARLWAESVLDRRFDNGEQFHWETFAPKDCQVMVKRDDKGFCRIEAIMGAPKRPAPRVATPLPPTPPESPAGVTI